MRKPVLVDTEVLIDYLRGYPTAVDLIREESQQIILTAIVVAELYAGVKGQTELAGAGGRYSRDYTKSHGLGLAEAIVAATVDAEDADLRTLNVKHYSMFGKLKPAYRKTTNGQPGVSGGA